MLIVPTVNASGCEYAGVGISQGGSDNAGNGVEPGGKSVSPTQYLTDIAANPSATAVNRSGQSSCGL